MKNTKKKIAPHFREAAAAGEIHVTDYFYAGTPRAADFGEGDDVSCVNCGAKISHVFMTDVGPMGGDCAATITGDESTRSAIRVKLPKMLAKMRNGRVSKLWIEHFGSEYAIEMSVRGTGYVREYDGAVLGARVETLAVVKTETLAKLLAGYAAEQTKMEYPEYYFDADIEEIK